MCNPEKASGAAAKRIKRLQNLFLHNPRERLLSSLFNSFALLFLVGGREREKESEHVKEPCAVGGTNSRSRSSGRPARATFLPSFKACMVVTVSGVGAAASIYGF